MSDKNDKILGKQLRQAMEAERWARKESNMIDKLARYFVALIILAGVISLVLWLLGGPK